MNALEIWNQIIENRKKAASLTITAQTRWKQANLRAKIIARGAGRVVDTFEPMPTHLANIGSDIIDVTHIEELDDSEIKELEKSVIAEKESLERNHNDEYMKLDNEAQTLINLLPDEIPPSVAEKRKLNQEISELRSKVETSVEKSIK